MLGRVLLIGGLLLSFGGAAIGSVGGGSASDDAEVKLEIVQPLSVTIGDIDFGRYVAGTNLSSIEESGVISITGEDGLKVNLEAESSNGGSLSNGGETITVVYSIIDGENITLDGGSAVRTLTASITEDRTDYITGIYTDTITVTATYQ